MTELSVEERCKRLAGLIAQSPPGEVNDVINDIRAIIGDDDALMPHVRPSLRAYNLSQLHPVEHPAEDGSPEHVSLLSEAAVLPGSSTDGKERYVDAEAKRSFAFDHVTLAVSDYEPYELPEEEATFRAELYKSLSAYTKDHFPSGYCSVSTSQFPLLPPAPPAPPAPAPAPAPAATSIESAPDAPVPDAEAGTDIEMTGEEKAGKAEPAPTPAVGNVLEKKEEVDEPGGLEKVDEKVEEVKEEEEAAEKAETEETKDDQEEAPTSAEEEATSKEEETVQEAEDPAPAQVDEGAPEATETTKPEAVEVVEQPAEPVPERKQEKVENPTYTLEIVGNRYNPPNFWTGRWRTQWVVDQAAGTVTGNIIVDVHYYEQGNVQLSTKHSASFPYPTASGSQSVASQIVTSISKLETNYHLELNDVYSELGDKAFKALRRALPITRQKMDWEKVSGYTLGADLTKART